MKKRTMVQMLGAAVVACVMACGLTPATVAPIAVLTVTEAACVIEHFGEPVLQILSDCNIGADKQQAVAELAAATARKVAEEKAAARCQ